MTPVPFAALTCRNVNVVKAAINSMANNLLDTSHAMQMAEDKYSVDLLDECNINYQPVTKLKILHCLSDAELSQPAIQPLKMQFCQTVSSPN